MNKVRVAIVVRMIVDAPALAYEMAVAKPMPREEPVTRTTKPGASVTLLGSVAGVTFRPIGGHQFIVWLAVASDMSDDIVTNS